MNRENIDLDSTDVWTKNIIQRYEDRPQDLEEVYLAEFVAWYASKLDCLDKNEVFYNDDFTEAGITDNNVRNQVPTRQYRSRKMARVIR